MVRHALFEHIDGADDPVIAALASANADVLRRSATPRRGLPSLDELAKAVADLRAVLFPWHMGEAGPAANQLAPYLRARLSSARARLRTQALHGFLFECQHDVEPCVACAQRADGATAALVERLPVVRAALEADAWAAFHGDPAATSPDEAIVCYPGFAAIVHHRLAHELYELGVPLVPRMISEIAHASTGIDIHPGARIGVSFFIDHGTGVVIGETAVIGERVRLYQGVTLGARSFQFDEQGRPLKDVPRHPIVEDDVVVYAGATILGRITIGRGSIIGGGVWVTHSLPPHANVTQAHFRRELFEGGGGI
jgi:serine O-acetyltransferase